MKYLQNLFIIIIMLATLSCNQQDKVNKQHYYFSLSDYFEKESERLQKASPIILKQVKKNNEVEERKLRIKNWNQEFESFLSSDINKPAWKRSYRVLETTRETEYIAIDPSLRTQKISLQKLPGGETKSITILNKVSNSLYSSVEQLTYYPDSVYQISKDQDVKILGRNTYKIVGKIKYR